MSAYYDIPKPFGEQRKITELQRIMLLDKSALVAPHISPTGLSAMAIMEYRLHNQMHYAVAFYPGYGWVIANSTKDLALFDKGFKDWGAIR